MTTTDEYVKSEEGEGETTTEEAEMELMGEEEGDKIGENNDRKKRFEIVLL